MLVLAALSSALAVAVPSIPATYTADVVAVTGGTASGVPKGTQTYKEYYDFANKRRRADYASQEYTKIYRYDVLIEPAFPPVKGDPTFASPKGYKIGWSGGAPNPRLDCCWTWLVDDEGNAERMFEELVPTKAVDAGAETKNGVASEHWHFQTNFPFPQTSDFWFATTGGALVESDTFASIFKQGTVLTNGSYTNFAPGPIDNSTFAVPTSDPTFGVCKPCTDPMCNCGNDRF